METTQAPEGQMSLMTKWSDVAGKVLSMAHGVEVEVSKSALPAPGESNGFRQSWGLPAWGQKTSWRAKLSDGRSIHVREFEDTYRVHWDAHDPGHNLAAHLLKDTPRLALGAGTSAGALAGVLVASAVGKDASLGGLIGALVGAALVAAGMGPGRQRIVTDLSQGRLIEG